MAKTYTLGAYHLACVGHCAFLRVGKANGLTAGKLKCLLAVQELREMGVRVKAIHVALYTGMNDRVGRRDVRLLVLAGYLAKGTVGKGSAARLTYELTAAGRYVVGEYGREIKAMQRKLVRELIK